MTEIFPRKDVFAWLKKEGAKKKGPMFGRTRQKTRFYAVLCLPGGKCLQNRYFKEQLSLTALASLPKR